MGYYLFDTWRAGALLALLVEVAVLIWWAYTRSPKSTWALLAGPALLGLTLLLDWAVETNREQAERITRQIVLAAQEEDAEKIIGMIDPGWSETSQWNYSKLCQRVRTLFSKPLIESNSIPELLVEYADDSKSRVVFRVLTIIDPKCPYRIYTPIVKTKWQFDFTRKGDNEYRLSQFTMLELNGGNPVDILTDSRLR